MMHAVVHAKEPSMSIPEELLGWPAWVPLLGLLSGALLFVSGVVWRKKRERALGLAAMAISLLMGILLYYSLK
jgi:hypothetical protein